MTGVWQGGPIQKRGAVFFLFVRKGKGEYGRQARTKKSVFKRRGNTWGSISNAHARRPTKSSYHAPIAITNYSSGRLDAILLLHFVTILGEGVTGYDEGIHRCWIHGWQIQGLETGRRWWDTQRRYIRVHLIEVSVVHRWGVIGAGTNSHPGNSLYGDYLSFCWAIRVVKFLYIRWVSIL